MTIQELKSHIENNTVPDTLIIFKNSDSDFLSKQYIAAIAKQKLLEINYIDDIKGVLQDSSSLFGDDEDIVTGLNVLKTDLFTWTNPMLKDVKNLIIVVNKFESKEVETLFNQYTVSVPKVEEWQWKDYVYSVADGIDTTDLDWLRQLCGNNTDRLEQELSKIRLFNKQERKYLFKDLVRDGMLDDLTSYNIFNFTNAVMSKNINSLLGIYKELDRVDINEFGLLTILLRNFKNLLLVQLNPNPTPENTGIDGKQLYAIKKQPRVYSPEQLTKIFQFLSDIDRQIKIGELPVDLLIDYMIIKILSI